MHEFTRTVPSNPRQDTHELAHTREVTGGLRCENHAQHTHPAYKRTQAHEKKRKRAP